MEIHLTVDELVETLKRSSLTTVVVEGKDDMTIYRWMEKFIGITKANFLPCGGRENLIRLFKRRHEFNHLCTVFLADKDCFVYDQVPNELENIIWTNGYSIENDLYHGRFVEKLLDAGEEVKFRISLKNFIRYYAFEVESFKNKIAYTFSTHPNQILDNNNELNNEFLAQRNFTQPNEETINYIEAKYDELIRGKSLFALLLRFLGHSKRDAKHNYKSLHETCLKLNHQHLIGNIIDEINHRLV
jgi:hypothetical protein